MALWFLHLCLSTLNSNCLKVAVTYPVLRHTLEYRINGMRDENNQGGWKWFDITVIRGLEQLGGGVFGEIENG